MLETRSSIIATASSIISFLMSALEVSDGCESIFFINGSVGSVTGLKDPCHVLKTFCFFLGLHRESSVLPDKTEYCRL